MILKKPLSNVEMSPAFFFYFIADMTINSDNFFSLLYTNINVKIMIADKSIVIYLLEKKEIYARMNEYMIFNYG